MLWKHAGSRFKWLFGGISWRGNCTANRGNDTSDDFMVLYVEFGIPMWHCNIKLICKYDARFTKRWTGPDATCDLGFIVLSTQSSLSLRFCYRYEPSDRSVCGSASCLSIPGKDAPGLALASKACPPPLQAHNLTTVSKFHTFWAMCRRCGRWPSSDAGKHPSLRNPSPLAPDRPRCAPPRGWSLLRGRVR